MSHPLGKMADTEKGAEELTEPTLAVASERKGKKREKKVAKMTTLLALPPETTVFGKRPAKKYLSLVDRQENGRGGWYTSIRNEDRPTLL